MKNYLGIMISVALPVLGATKPAAADDKQSFIIDMTHAYYAAYELCPGTRVNSAALFAEGWKVGLDKKDVIDVESALRRLNGNTTTDKPPAQIAKTVAFAATMITAEINRKPKEAWCDFRVPKLVKQGILSPADPGPFAIEPGNKASAYGGSDELFRQSITPPNPHSDFSEYEIESAGDTGICAIHAKGAGYYGTMLEPKAPELDIKALFQKVKEQLDRKYGEGQIRKSRETIDPQKNELVSIDVTTSTWEKPKAAEGKTVALEKIVLSYQIDQKAEGGRTPLDLSYILSNYSKCQQIKKGLDYETMSDEGSKL